MSAEPSYSLLALWATKVMAPLYSQTSSAA